MKETKGLYFIALLPPPPIQVRVTRLKEEIQERFGAGHALKSPPHITLQMPFRLPHEQEAELKLGLAHFSAGFHPFSVRLKDFDAFSPRVIYIAIANPERIKHIRSALMQWFDKSEAWHMIKRSDRFHPHMTIATRDLSDDNFHRAWPEFRSREFEAVFEATQLTLLKHNGKHWDILSNLTFNV